MEILSFPVTSNLNVDVGKKLKQLNMRVIIEIEYL